MIQEKIIRKEPLFELYFENNHLIINNADHAKDNCVINLKDVLNLELIRNLSIIDKFIEITFGFGRPSKSDVLRINMTNGFKDVVLTACTIKKVGLIIYEINQIIIKQINNTNPV